MKFDTPDAGLYLSSHVLDMPPATEYCVSAERDGKTALLISDTWLPIETDLQSEWPVFSDHVEERGVHYTSGRAVGDDHWGYFKSGEEWKRWRLVKFIGGGEAGYLPTPLKEAQLYDQIISSACVPPLPQGPDGETWDVHPVGKPTR
jgi:hypothetical protein